LRNDRKISNREKIAMSLRDEASVTGGMGDEAILTPVILNPDEIGVNGSLQHQHQRQH
jgi:hypothetical protein